MNRICVAIGVMIVMACHQVANALPEDIRDLSHHFNDPGGVLSPWTFIPDSNIHELATTDHPGLLAIRMNGVSADIKGLLEEPIPIDQYRVPWEFQTSYMQNFSLLTGRNTTQTNYAIGINVGVTWSDPESWPEDRLTPPDDMRTAQLLVVHIGNYGEVGPGLPQYSEYPAPESFHVWGRGDLGHTTHGDWQIPTIWIGDGAFAGGPASDQLFFRVVVESPTRLQIGIKFDPAHGWNMRDIDISHLGPITGIWEIGPVISGDDWIPEIFARSIPVRRGVNLLMPVMREYKDHRKIGTEIPTPPVLPPDPKFPQYLDYCVFFGSTPIPLEHYSDEFNIPGYLGQWQIQPQLTMVDTWSMPGHLTMTMLGPSLGTGFGAVGASDLHFTQYPPPWEIEWSFIAPDDTIPWNIFCNFVVLDREGEMLGVWQPGFRNYTDERGVQYINHLNHADPPIQVHFDPEVPQEIMRAKPLFFLLQVLDESRFRVAVKGNESDPWIFSAISDTKDTVGKEVGTLGLHVYSSISGREWGGEPGMPVYSRLHFDYLRYRNGTTEP